VRQQRKHHSGIQGERFANSLDLSFELLEALFLLREQDFFDVVQSLADRIKLALDHLGSTRIKTDSRKVTEIAAQRVVFLGTGEGLREDVQEQGRVDDAVVSDLSPFEEVPW